MEKCAGLHCSGCGSHGGGPGLAVALLIVVLVAAGSAAARAVWHDILTALEITGYVLAGLTGLAVLGGLAYGGLRIRAHMIEVRDRRVSPRVHAVITDVKAGRTVELGEVTHGSINADLPSIEAPRMRPAGWPLPGQWDEIRPGGGERRAN